MQKVLIIGDGHELLPVLERMVKEKNCHIWFVKSMRQITALLKDHDVTLIVVNCNKKHDVRLFTLLNDYEKTKNIRKLLYNPESIEGPSQSKKNISLQESSYNTEQIESVLLNEYL